MKGLLKKEWFVLWNKPILIILPVLMFTVMGIAAKSLMLILYLPLYAGILPVSLITTDETSRWERFALGMPYSRKALVSAKYLMSILLVLAGTLLSAVLLLFIWSSGFTAQQCVLMIAALTAGSLLLPSVLLPLNLKFGTAKARLALGVLLAVCGCLSATSLNREGEDVQFNLFAKIAAWGLSPALLTVLLLAAAVILTTVSWLISMIIYKRKQF